MGVVMDIMRFLMGHLSEADLIGIALEGLEGDQRAKAEVHLRQCALCRAALREWLEIHDALAATVPVLEEPAGLSARIVEAYRRERWPL